MCYFCVLSSLLAGVCQYFFYIPSSRLFLYVLNFLNNISDMYKGYQVEKTNLLFIDSCKMAECHKSTYFNCNCILIRGLFDTNFSLVTYRACYGE